MGATNRTTHYNLPVFIASDRPSWMGDFNSAMEAVDAACYSTESSADAATATANNAVTVAGEAVTAAQNAITKANEAMTNSGEWTSPITILATDWVADDPDEPTKWVYVHTNTTITVDSLLDLYFDQNSVEYIEQNGTVEATQANNTLTLTANFEPTQTIILQAIHIINL